VVPNAANGIGLFQSFAKDALGAVAGQLQMYGSAGGAVLMSVLNLPMLFCTNSIERMRISAAGNVGIGTSSPSAKLNLATGSTALQIDPNFLSTGNAYIQYTGSGALIVGTGDVNPLVLITNTVGRVVIDANGTINTQANPITNCPTTAKAWAYVTGLVNTNGAAQTFTGNNVASIVRGATAGLYTITLTSGTFSGSVVISAISGTNNSGASILSYTGNACVVQTYVGATATDMLFNMVYFSN
jgi:hypothetical protein